MGPAREILDICGGAEVVADWLGLKHASTVYRWAHAKQAGGCDGYIPSCYHEPILLRARAEKKPLRAEHFFPTIFPQFAPGGARHHKARA
jgi:hypothetical protein